MDHIETKILSSYKNHAAKIYHPQATNNVTYITFVLQFLSHRRRIYNQFPSAGKWKRTDVSILFGVCRFRCVRRTSLFLRLTKCQTKPLYFAFKRSGGRVGGFFCILRRFAKYILLPYVLMPSHNGRKCVRMKP